MWNLRRGSAIHPPWPFLNLTEVPTGTQVHTTTLEGPEASSPQRDEEGRTSRRQLLICERKGPRSAALSGTGYCCRNSSTVLRTSSADRETPRCLLAASTGRTRSMKPAARGGVLRGAVVP